jgi:hypothetical protein
MKMMPELQRTEFVLGMLGLLRAAMIFRKGLGMGTQNSGSQLTDYHLAVWQVTGVT